MLVPAHQPLVPRRSPDRPRRPRLWRKDRGVSDGSKIEWTDATVNAINGCSLASPGCTNRSEKHTSELQSLMRISYAVFCLTKKKTNSKLTIRLMIRLNNIRTYICS